MAELPETDRIDPPAVTVKLSNGSAVNLLRLKTRQMFRLLKIITHGGLGSGIVQMVNFSDPPEVFVQQILTILLLSIPDSEQETLQFLAVMVEPYGLVRKAKLNKQDEEANALRWSKMNDFLTNPPVDDTFTLIEEIIKQEAPEFQALGKRLAQTLALFQRTGQDKEPKAPEPANEELAASAAGSPASP
jgi:hypothetical protein